MFQFPRRSDFHRAVVQAAVTSSVATRCPVWWVLFAFFDLLHSSWLYTKCDGSFALSAVRINSAVDGPTSESLKSGRVAKRLLAPAPTGYYPHSFTFWLDCRGMQIISKQIFAHCVSSTSLIKFLLLHALDSRIYVLLALPFRSKVIQYLSIYIVFWKCAWGKVGFQSKCALLTLTF